MSSHHGRRESKDKKSHGDKGSSKTPSGFYQTGDESTSKGKHRSNYGEEEGPASLDSHAAFAHSTSYPGAPADSQSYQQNADYPDIGQLSLGQQQYPYAAVKNQVQSHSSDPLNGCPNQCTWGYVILDPEPRPQPVFPNEGDNRAYAKYQKDLEEWEKDYLKYKDISCRCKKAYYCKAHGQFVSGADVRNGKAPSQSDQTPETCHKKGYFCREHKQWVSDADVESRHSTDQKCQTRATCHTDGYFCTKHKRWVPGDMIRNRVAPSQRKQTPETCHIFAKDQNTTLHPPPVDESCELGNGIVASRFKPTADYGGGQSSSIGYIASAPIAGNVNYAQQSSYTVSSQSQYQVYTSTPATTGYTGYPAPQNLDFGPQPSNPASASSEASYSVRQSTPAYNAAYAAQKYSTATVSTTPYQYPASELQATLSYQSASSLVAERYDDRDPPAQSQYDRSAGYEGSYSLAPAQQSSTKYQVARYGATPSSSTPVEYAQPEGSRDYEEVYQEDSRQSSRRHKGDHVQSSRRDKKKSSKG